MKKRKVKKWVYVVILVVLLVLFAFTLFNFLKLVINYSKTKNLVTDLQKEVTKDVIVDDSSSEEERYTLDFSSLKKKNTDTVGWLEIKDTSINYPLVQTNNNNYYLTHSFDKSNNVNGWVFVNYINNKDFSDQNTTIFAHDSLFKPLKNIYNSNNKDNFNIYIYLEDKVYIYEAFSLYITDSYNVEILKDNLSSDVLQQVIENSSYDYNVEVDENDHILTLSTCFNEGEKRIIVHAKKL